jgi:hypothetical protein
MELFRLCRFGWPGYSAWKLVATSVPTLLCPPTFQATTFLQMLLDYFSANLRLTSKEPSSIYKRTTSTARPDALSQPEAARMLYKTFIPILSIININLQTIYQARKPHFNITITISSTNGTKTPLRVRVRVRVFYEETQMTDLAGLDLLGNLTP